VHPRIERDDEVAGLARLIASCGTLYLEVLRVWPRWPLLYSNSQREGERDKKPELTRMVGFRVVRL
jgi:hypothetical protein